MQLPYWRLSAFYACFFASLGALLPFFALYLQSRGFDPVAIGELMAILLATKIVAPNVWGWIADTRGGRMPLIRGASVFAALSFAALTAGSGFWWVAGVMVVFGFFWNAALPQFEVVTLGYLGAGVERYSRVRLWGSVGFIAAVVIGGEVIDRGGAGWVIGLVLVPMVGIVAVSLLVAEPPERPPRNASAPLREVLSRSSVIALLMACLLMQASHGPYYVFFSIYLDSAGYEVEVIGWLWALGVAAEVGLFAAMPRLIGWLSLRSLFVGAFLLSAVRWVLVAFFLTSWPIIALSQTLHAASFGVYHAVAIALIHRYFSAGQRGRGQALYASVSFGAGGALGSLFAGFAWVAIGPTATWLVAAGTCVVATLVVWRWIAEEDPVAAEMSG